MRHWIVRLADYLGGEKCSLLVEDPDGWVYAHWTLPILNPVPLVRSTEIGQLREAVRQHFEARPRHLIGRNASGEIDFELQECTLEPGTYHPRVWRGNLQRDVRAEDWMFSCLQSLRLLDDRLQMLARYVEPHEKNLHAFGHEMRHLLILACTEVESSWKAILKANGCTANNDRWGTQDYVKLHRPLRLAEWSVVLPLHQNYGAITPFADWDPAQPTKSLAWYDAYNATKHDRENSLALATLEHAIEATAAACVMALAQMGPEIVASDEPNGMRSFWVDTEPKWRLDELYLPGRPAGRDRVPVMLSF